MFIIPRVQNCSREASNEFVDNSDSGESSFSYWKKRKKEKNGNTF